MVTTEMFLAAEYVNKNKQLSLDDLAPAVRLILDKIAAQGVRVCGSCRYTSGCLRCDLWKAQRYYLGKEANARGVPMPTKW